MSLIKARLRYSEWILLFYFAYVALIGPFFRDRPHLGAQPLFVLIWVIALVLLMAAAEQTRFAGAICVIRDWLPIPLTLAAFWEMELFLPVSFAHHYEAGWVQPDHLLLSTWHVRAAIESLGPTLPFYLELCYLFVYGLAAYCLAILYTRNRRSAVDRFLVIYLTGTLTAYALFPYFPSQPPRIAFPRYDDPQITTWVRNLNLGLLNRATIHVGVFPSAHVSSAFSAAWAMFLLLPKRKLVGWCLLLYAASVSLATVYGRYHYAADVFAGVAVSILAAVLYLLFQRFITDLPAPATRDSKSR